MSEAEFRGLEEAALLRVRYRDDAVAAAQHASERELGRCHALLVGDRCFSI